MAPGSAPPHPIPNGRLRWALDGSPRPSHGAHHIQCEYAIELGHAPGTRYRWRTWENNLLGEHTPALCNSLAAAVAEDILRTTQDCSDLDAGAYWGHVLEPA